ncbi:MAG: membrane protein insertion efficiency factor YidD [Saprospiraceae bacterium]|jgi:putative membrane protein insertion efficiency factor|nr:membrane protein insertion efficiency factor YidD [Saprospiraceae bacterium]MCA0332860.1 membrane protein insertion efficiency factor YidD [Bacteroidota bacterium]MCO5277074.1 membrane protein insertion efficiency factor YidD [Saprospiraceae bacterium]
MAGFKHILGKIFILPIRFYQLAISPLLGANKCRYQPTCSHYAIEAIEKWGILQGTWMAIKRILSCHPWGGHGYDPVPLPPDKNSK